jgi:hypothetical protein
MFKKFLRGSWQLRSSCVIDEGEITTSSRLSPTLLSNKKQRSVKGRVTRLGEFSPNGQLFTLGSYMKITEASHIFGLPWLSLNIKLARKWFGLQFGRFF